MSLKSIIFTAALAAISGANPLPQGGSSGGNGGPLAVVRAYDAGGCTGNSVVLTFSNNGTCADIATAAQDAGLSHVASAKVVDYEVNGCSASFSLTYPTCQLQGTPGILNQCEQGNGNFEGFFLRCPAQS